MLAEDLTQETFLSAFRHLDQLRNPARMTPWLSRIAKNLCFTALKQQKNLPLLQEMPLFQERAVPSQSPAHPEHRESQIQAIFEAMEGLPPKQRAVFELHDVA